ncbi:MAG: hypothetical protein JXR51_10870 [Bacteroidales bacterium]|nr:hypothetical protein [Bacteroidales bacterium]MBN2757670.1 hypothetical protein [Bacteroidales bacterium]
MNTKILIIIVNLFFFSQLINSQSTKTDSLTNSSYSVKNQLLDNNDTFSEMQSEYLSNSETDHQKLLRNIFAAGFVFIFLILIFIIFFYGTKIKKINELITKQNILVSSSKDQLVKIIAVFNYLNQMVFITDKEGVIEWANDFSLPFLNQDYTNQKINLLNNFSDENKNSIKNAIDINSKTEFIDNILLNKAQWKIIPISNANQVFSNIVFIGTVKSEMQKIIDSI